MHADPHTVRMLDDKHAFSEPRPSSGCPCPSTTASRTRSQVGVARRRAVRPQEHPLRPGAPARPDAAAAPDAAGDAAFAAARPISRDTPWILQGFVAGEEYCTHSTVRDGVVQAALLLRVVGLPGQLRDGRQAGRSRRGCALRRRAAASPARCRSTSSRPPTARRTRSSATRARTRRSRSSTTTPTSRGAYLEDGVVEVAAATRGQPDVLALPRALARWRPAATARAALRTIAARHATRSSPGTTRCRSCWSTTSRSRRCCWRNLRTGKDWIRIDFNIGKLVEPGGD